MSFRLAVSLSAVSLFSTAALAAPVHYTIDPDHTFPSFEAPHIQGISTWRGKLDKSSGSVILDREAHTGSLSVTVEAASIDFGHQKLNEHVKGPDFFDVEKYPTITYVSDTIKFTGDQPSQIDGQLTFHGVTKPVVLKINSFKCIMHPMLKKEVCGADASAEFNRADFGVGKYAEMMGSPMVKLAIQVEADKD